MTSGTGTPYFDGDEIGVGRAAVRGAIIGTVVVAGVVVAITLYAGASLGDAVGMAAYAAFFGGPGFGAMLGAVHFLSREHSSAPAAVAASAEQVDGDRRGGEAVRHRSPQRAAVASSTAPDAWTSPTKAPRTPSGDRAAPTRQKVPAP